MSLTVEELSDLLVATRVEIGPPKWSDISQDLQEFTALPQILRKNRSDIGSGKRVDWKVQVSTLGAARMRALYEPKQYAGGDMLRNVFVPWKHLTTDYIFDRIEMAMNSGANEILNLFKVRRHAAMTDKAKLLEDQIWGLPDADSDQDLSIYGIYYWIVKHITGTSATGGGFNGGNHARFSNGPGNLSATTYPRWSNWTFKYTNVSKPDMIRKLREASAKTRFNAPIPYPQLSGNSWRYGYYVPYETLATFEEEAEKQNSNLGNDVASKDGHVLFKGNPVKWVPALDADTDVPIFGIDWNTLKPFFLKGEYMREDKPHVVAGSPTVVATDVDCTLNLRCFDRRRLFVGTKTADYKTT